jgi:hypothetical protein
MIAHARGGRSSSAGADAPIRAEARINQNRQFSQRNLKRSAAFYVVVVKQRRQRAVSLDFRKYSD